MDLIFRSGATASSANAGIFIAVLAGVVIYYLIEKTKFGYELKACGYNRCARYGDQRDTQHRAFHGHCGRALGPGRRMPSLGGAAGNEVLDTLAAEGFNGIPVALLGLNNPIGIIFRPARGVFETRAASICRYTALRRRSLISLFPW